MKVPLSWLAEYVEVPVEPKRLAEDLTLAGLAVDAVEPHGKDTVLDLDITTNRVDCMNVYGVAREVGTLYDKPLKPLDVAFEESGPPAERQLAVEIEAPELCPRFCARVLDVKMGPSPPWIRDRLELVGVRPISNVVDLTNYVMLEMGHPSHAFDLARIPEGRLRVRWAREGERLRTLDGVDRTLGRHVGVVAGPDGALALAGIMGGESSEVSEGTRTVALEAAYWDPLTIRRGARSLGMHTEASHRFERGADPEGCPVATARIAALLRRIEAGTVRPGLIDRHPAPRPRRSVVLRASRVRAVLGADVPIEETRGILSRLGFGLGAGANGTVSTEVPTWRGDVSREVDLIEEVARHHGLARIPSTLPAAGGVEGLRPGQKAERRIREVLVGASLCEAVNSPFVTSAGGEGQVPVAIQNPLAEDQGLLRSSLSVPGLVGTLRTNLRQGRRDVALFELGRAFHPARPMPREERRLALLLAGRFGPGHWSGKRRPVDFFDLKGILESVTASLGLPAFELAEGEVPRWLHPGQSAVVLWRGRRCGALGAVHPESAAAWELREEAFLAEVTLDTLLAEPPRPARFRPLPRSPAVARDLSALGDASVRAADLEAAVRSAAGELLQSVIVVDRYDRPPVPEGKVSLTLTLVFQDPARTLTGDEVQASVERVVSALRSQGIEIRGE